MECFDKACVLSLQGEVNVTQKKERGGKKLGRVKENSELMVRIGDWFGRKPTTLWSMLEADALKSVNPTEDELLVMRGFYEADIPKKEDIRRRDIITMLNNWTGEYDKAVEFKRINGGG